MAETGPSLDLDRIERDLRNLVTPDFEEIAALVAENRRLTAENSRQARALTRIAGIVQHLAEYNDHARTEATR